MTCSERILDERKSMFAYTDQQAQRFMQVYRDLKCKNNPPPCASYFFK
jgi:hypothetical protein